jgi:hypothetical protein
MHDPLRQRLFERRPWVGQHFNLTAPRTLSRTIPSPRPAGCTTLTARGDYQKSEVIRNGTVGQLWWAIARPLWSSCTVPRHIKVRCQATAWDKESLSRRGRRRSIGLPTYLAKHILLCIPSRLSMAQHCIHYICTQYMYRHTYVADTTHNRRSSRVLA